MVLKGSIRSERRRVVRVDHDSDAARGSTGLGANIASIADSTSNPSPFYTFDEHAKGGKLRCIPKERSADSIRHLESRALTISHVALICWMIQFKRFALPPILVFLRD